MCTFIKVYMHANEKSSLDVNAQVTLHSPTWLETADALPSGPFHANVFL